MKFFEGKNIKGKKESGSQKSGKKFKNNKETEIFFNTFSGRLSIALSLMSVSYTHLFFDWLKREKVLARYKNLDFLDRVFWGISKRVRKGEILRNAVCELRKNYGEFEEKSLKEFLFVKGKIVENFEGSEKL